MSSRFVLLDFDDWDITLREVLFSIGIAGVLLGIGFFFSDMVVNMVDRQKLEYRQAAQIRDKGSFRYAIKTGLGNSFFAGDVKALDPVSHKKFDGKWLSMDLTYQSYNMHTRTVTYTDSKGHVHTRTEIYWSWDTYDTQKLQSKAVDVNGMEFVTDFFNFRNCIESKCVGNGFHRRILCDMIPTAFSGTGYAFLAPDIENRNKGGVDFYKDWTIEQAYEDYTNSCALLVFWLCWILFTGLIIWLFYVVDNEWLEDDGSGFYRPGTNFRYGGYNRRFYR